MSENEEFEFRARAEKEKAPKSEEPGFGEKAGAALYGATTGVLGGLGELEKFGIYTVPQALGFQEPGEKQQLAGRETLFPTIEEVQKGLSKFDIKKPREDVSGYQTAGEIVGGLGPSLPGMIKGGAKALLGTPTVTRAASAKAAEDLGFKLSPTQVRQAEPIAEKGATGWGKENQTLANKLASKGTGVEVAEIDEKFIGDRLKDLGKEYDKIYKGNRFNIDKNAVDAIKQISATEAQLPGVAGVSPVKQVADEIITNFDRLSRLPGAKPNTFTIDGEALQRMRNALTQRARSTSASNAREIYNLVDQIDASIAANHPAIAAKLDVIRPQYRNSIILEDLFRSGGIQGGDISLERLGNMMRTDRGVARRTGKEIDDLAKIGRDTKLKAMWEKTAEGDAGLKQALGTTLGYGASALGLKSRPARAIQRTLTTTPTKRIPGAAPTAAGVIPGQLQKEQ